jgi:hypothetical protein
MYPFRQDPLIRIRISAPGGEDPRTYRQQPHPPATVAAVKALIEGTRLPHKVIGHRTGVNPGTVSRWREKYGWQRPPGAPPSTRRPGTRYVPVLLGRALSQRIRIQAERLVTEIERAPRVDPEELKEALSLLEEARLAQYVRRGQRLMPPRHPPPPPEGRGRRQRDRHAAALKSWSTRWARFREREAALLEAEQRKAEARGDPAGE